MKKTKVLLAGALVLALGLVMGCKTSLDESVAEHTQGASKFEHVWKAEYKDNDQYIRSALQFGSGEDEITKADVDVEMLYPQYGKSGLIFGLTNSDAGKDANGEKIIKYNYYILGLGEKPNQNSGTLQYYIDYCTNMTSLSGGNTSDDSIDTSTGAESTTVVALTDITDAGHRANEPLEYSVSFSFTEDSQDPDNVVKGKYTVTIKVGEKTITHEIDHANYGYDGTTPMYAAKGTIASYGMLSGLNKDLKKVNTTWTVNRETLEGAGLNGVKLSAE